VTNSEQAVRRPAPGGRRERIERTAAAVEELLAAVGTVRDSVARTEFPVETPSADGARATADALLEQIDDYLVPRLSRLDAPLLAVVGGPTGAGKSTLVNSLVRAPVSPAGALRPTTRAPLVVCHSADAPWFASGELLPGLVRGTRPGERTLQLATAPELTPGLALLDAPDIDSVVRSNRELGNEVLAAGDLWLFVTTSNRYADAVPWAVLRGALERGTPVAIVLDRVPEAASGEVASHLGQMLSDNGLGGAPLFVIPHSTLDGQGLLPERTVAPLKRWIDLVARDAARRTATAQWTLLGAVRALQPRLEFLAEAAQEQTTGVAALTGSVRQAYAAAEARVEENLSRGHILRGEVRTQWQELVSDGELRRLLRTRNAGRLGLSGRTPPGRRLVGALATGLTQLICDAAAEAAEECYLRWSATPAGVQLLAEDPRREPGHGPGLRRASPGLAQWAGHSMREWQRGIREAARNSGPAHKRAAESTARPPGPGERSRRAPGRGASYDQAATSLLAMIAAVTPEVAPEDPDAGWLARIRGNPAVTSLADLARHDLLVRVSDLFVAEAARYGEPLVAAGVDERAAHRLRAGSSRLSEALTTMDSLVDQSSTVDGDRASPSTVDGAPADSSTMDKNRAEEGP
jgi:hypothetical protein